MDHILSRGVSLFVLSTYIHESVGTEYNTIQYDTTTDYNLNAKTHNEIKTAIKVSENITLNIAGLTEFEGEQLYLIKWP